MLNNVAGFGFLGVNRFLGLPQAKKPQAQLRLSLSLSRSVSVFASE